MNRVMETTKIRPSRIVASDPSSGTFSVQLSWCKGNAKCKLLRTLKILIERALIPREFAKFARWLADVTERTSHYRVLRFSALAPGVESR